MERKSSFHANHVNYTHDKSCYSGRICMSTFHETSHVVFTLRALPCVPLWMNLLRTLPSHVYSPYCPEILVTRELMVAENASVFISLLMEQEF